MNASSSKPLQATPVATDPAGAKPARARRSPLRWLLMLALPLALIVGGAVYWLTGGRYETTENANLRQAVVSVASDLSGRVVAVNIADNQVVKAGDLLFSIDPEPYRLALAQAEAAVAGARLQVEQLRVGYAQAQANAMLAADDAAYQASELERQRALSTKGVASATALDDAQHEAQRARELKGVADQQVASALAALGNDPQIATDSHPTVMAALAARDEAAYKLGLTEVRAPADGVIYQAASFKPGQMVGAGTRLFALVETGDVWIDANFKETQLAGIRVGQPAEVVFDLYPDQPVEAVVEAVGAGTGAEFSLLPAQNATGNWVKVTQRVPVRLRLAEPTELSLASGLSAEVSVDTGRSRSLGFTSHAAALN
ncbi:HlyD family secretion protein [Cereibacter changlensis]|uniref:HlyD family secretion protein n=1 Tax=Cereibacter changlensis TaxID=402884 RepID=A0A4U0Z2T5_9RHOB|nr:HlyD family secretion protein [Cereibacter changlensis]TKA96814.1 HlyD family secretion protein [Cereibacter changlensis]